MSTRTATCAAWRLILAGLGAWAMAMEFGAALGRYNPVAWHYFTDLSNLAATLYFAFAGIWCLVRRPDPDGTPAIPAPRVKHAVTMALAVTFFVANALLLGVLAAAGDAFALEAFGYGWREVAQLFILHYAVPVMAAGDWLLFERKGAMGAREPLAWMLAPLAYLAYVMMYVNVLGIPMAGGVIGSGRYPYPFLDVDLLGLPAVLACCALLLAIFVALGFGWRRLDASLATRESRGMDRAEGGTSR